MLYSKVKVRRMVPRRAVKSYIELCGTTALILSLKVLSFVNGDNVITVVSNGVYKR